MKSDECGLKDECIEFLCDFPDRVPHRCSLCTPIVRYVLERLKEQKAAKDEDIWRGNCYDG